MRLIASVVTRTYMDRNRNHATSRASRIVPESAVAASSGHLGGLTIFRQGFGGPP